MEDLSPELEAQRTRSAEYDRAVDSLNAAKMRKAARGHAVMSAALGYGESAMGDGMFGKISHAAKLFCIAFAFLAPSLLVWRVLL
ncbi:hypothetical protein [Thalassococcus sp. S3]|uniref:hypothetical protein n=1 Tax=Thalassococcus sp. S3 TaxID=2017482 RepID=UPI0010245FB6|nr:hypothetical protein [Thalassococcus sp. S3]QBF30281.1 hypothetical protein CFI11_03490 [Thalassococcus sp. S3]